MKFLVVASDAQSGVIAGSKDKGAIHNGMWALTLLPWRLAMQDYTCNVFCSSFFGGYGTCSVACLELEMVDGRPGRIT